MEWKQARGERKRVEDWVRLGEAKDGKGGEAGRAIDGSCTRPRRNIIRKAALISAYIFHS